MRKANIITLGIMVITLVVVSAIFTWWILIPGAVMIVMFAITYFTEDKS